MRVGFQRNNTMNWNLVILLVMMTLIQQPTFSFPRNGSKNKIRSLQNETIKRNKSIEELVQLISIKGDERFDFRKGING
jgi:hypothetical protein